MEKVIKSLIEYFYQFRTVAGGILEPALPWLYTIAGALTILFIFGIFYCAITSGYANARVERWLDSMGKDVGKRRQLRAWKEIVKHSRSGQMSDWKLAIAEADTIFDEILKASGFRGVTLDDRFKQIQPEFIANRDQILAAHQVRDRVMREPDFMISQQEAIDALRVYQKALTELGMLD